MKIIHTLFICLLLLSTVVSAQNAFNESKFFESLESNDIQTVEASLKMVQRSTIKEKEAYRGALLMKKAGLVSGPRAKLNLFKEGHGLLEKAIDKEPSNVTYRFLRMIIQENAPWILNYNDDIEVDAKVITVKFDTLSPAIKSAVIYYGKKSKYLRIS
jgi:hypothetical protein